MNTSSQIALVTGGARGIGAAICRALADCGHRVVVTDIAAQGASALAKEIGGESVAMDVTSANSVSQASEQIAREIGAPTIVVNNAGWDNLMPFLETDEEFQNKVIAINYTGPVRVCRAFLPGMIAAGGGRIINIASDAGRIGSALEAIYSGTKGGLIAFSKTLAREFARNQITVNCVCPGITNTPLIKEITANNELAGRGIAAIERNVPLGRMGQPEDIAGAVVYLASEAASYVTGQTLSVSGGISMAG